MSRLHSFLRPQIAIQRPVLNGLVEVGGFDGIGSLQVGDGAGDLQDAVVGAGAKSEFLHRHFQHVLAILVQGAVGADQTRVHPGVAGDLAAGEPLLLDCAGVFDPAADDLGGFPRLFAGDLCVLNGRHFDMNVDAVQKRTADALAVLKDLAGIAAAEPFGIVGVSARIGTQAGRTCA